MRVHLIKVQSIENYVLENGQSRKAFETWLSIVKRADWNSPQDIVRTFNSTDILEKGSNRVVFNNWWEHVPDYLPVLFWEAESTSICQMDWNTCFLH